MRPPLDYVPTDPPTPNPYPRRAIKRGLIAASVAAAAASAICFFPVETFAISAMVGTVWSGSRFCAWLDRDDSQPDYSDGVAGE